MGVWWEYQPLRLWLLFWLTFDKVSARTRICVHIYSNCDNVKLLNVNVTLTFEVGTWFLDATHCFDVVDICAKLFQNPSMYDKITVRTWIKWGRTDGRTDRRFDFNMPPFGVLKVKSFCHIFGNFLFLGTTFISLQTIKYILRTWTWIKKNICMHKTNSIHCVGYLIDLCIATKAIFLLNK
jgi:hypothetical protein